MLVESSVDRAGNPDMRKDRPTTSEGQAGQARSFLL